MLVAGRDRAGEPVEAIQAACMAISQFIGWPSGWPVEK